MTPEIATQPFGYTSSGTRFMIFLWLCGMIMLFPIKIFAFPFNMELMDFWILGAMPFLWLFLIARPQTIINWTYIPVMLIILTGSLVSTIAAPLPRNSIIVISKETYVFVWFITLIVLFCEMSTRNLHRIIVVWNRVAVIHGLFIIAQFLWPELWRITISLSRNIAEYEHYRSPGLFPNANAAAFFQLMGFVPLVLAKESRPRTITMGIILFLSLLATGSMGALLGLSLGVLAALAVMTILTRNLTAIIKYFLPFLIVLLFLGGLFSLVISQSQSYKSHLESIVVGRADRSSGGRFDLWQRGMEAFIDYSGVLWGIGPENFREVDGRDKQLHNDFIAFSVERGLLMGIALLFLVVVAMSRAVYLFKSSNEDNRLEVVVFISAIVAIFIESLFHQIFHYRELWLVLAFQEAIIFKRKLNKINNETLLPGVRDLGNNGD